MDCSTCQEFFPNGTVSIVYCIYGFVCIINNPNYYSEADLAGSLLIIVRSQMAESYQIIPQKAEVIYKNNSIIP